MTQTLDNHSDEVLKTSRGATDERYAEVLKIQIPEDGPAGVSDLGYPTWGR